ncbi:unnamed protein product [Ambrosiozyma monospora]|uniref:Unnamed protein product n=1 Tax=Ambrosiozyma monospora TaxID=43982 RepID=A0ACB5SXJ9_AMBMO|nr:unnamed protein product [Ambrosiozyma monospora]
MYERSKRMVNLKLLVVVEDNQSSPISQALNTTAHTLPISALAGWVIKTGLSESEIIRKVHHQKYWGAIYVTSSDLSSNLISSFNEGSYYNTTDVVRAYYETGRDPNGMNSYVIPAISKFSLAYQTILEKRVYPELLANVSDSTLVDLRDNGMLTSYPTVNITDGAPMTAAILMAPLMVGLIYIIILTFFQVLWFIKINADAAKVLNPKSYILYRALVLQCNFLVLSLAYTALNSAFQISYNKSWSGGFGVAWMTHYLTMSAVGGANENISLLCFATLPPLMGFWMLSFVVLNISATFSPIEVCPKIFRFTYAMPIKNAYEIMKIIFFDSYRGNLGRYFGILVAWVVLNMILHPLCLMFFSMQTKKKIQKEAQEAEAQREAKKQHN